MNKYFLLPLLFLSFLAGSPAFSAGSKTLVELKDGKPVAALAKSWKKIKNGEFEFVLDTSVELTDGKALTTGAVKTSLEKKLATSHGVSVLETGPNTVVVKYSGDEKAFFDQLATLKIRAVSTDVADTTGPGDGIRARPKNTVLAEGEVRGFVLKKQKEYVSFKIIESKDPTIKKGEILNLKLTQDGIEKNMYLFFMPEKNEAGFWLAKDGTLYRK